MDSKTKIILLVVAIVVLGLPIAGRLMHDEPAPTQQPAVSVPPEPPVPSVPPPPAASGPALSRRAPNRNAPASQAQTRQLTAQSLVNTSWSLQGVTVTFLAGGRATARVPGMSTPIDAAWNVNGNMLTVTAMDQSYSVQIAGNQLLVNGMPAQRVQ